MKQILDSVQVSKTLKRITHEIIERHDGLDNIVLLGIKSKGMPIAKIIKKTFFDFTGVNVSCLELDIRAYRDDHKKIIHADRLKLDVNDKTIILIDDVLYTGRSVRAALDAVVDMGRPAKVEFAVLVDRGHRELPIRGQIMWVRMSHLVKLKYFILNMDEFVNVY